MTDDVVVVLTALEDEYKAVRHRIINPQVQTHEHGTQYEVGLARGTNYQIALALTDKGNQPAAVLAERAITEFSPIAVLFVGVAGALREGIRPGDVVVATHVYAYHGGISEDDGTKSRPRVWEMDHGTSQLARHVSRSIRWSDEPTTGNPVPGVYFGPIASGEIVHNSRVSYEAEWLRQHYNDTCAIDMEAAGVAQAGHLNRSPIAIIRGISDRADGTKTTAADMTWQPQAAENAAAFALTLANQFHPEQEKHTMRNRGDGDNGSVTNIAHSNVGIQAKMSTTAPSR